MLISMPTGTSTIFGAFQAILALLANGTIFRPVDKLPCHEKFASEIFYRKPPRVLCCSAKSYCDTLSPGGFKTTHDQRVCDTALRNESRHPGGGDSCTVE
jgi:hypothetical protein